MARMIRNKLVSTTQPTDGQVLTFVASSNTWECKTLVASEGGGPHATSHAYTGNDVVTPAAIGACADNDARLSDTRTPKAHSHEPAEVTGTAVVDNDARLTNARTPVVHDSTKHSVAYAAASDLTTHMEAASPHSGHESTTNKGQANGYAGLGVDGKVPAAQLPASSGSSPAWHGALYSAFGDCDPAIALQMMQCNPINATPTNIAITVARCAYFKPPADITVQKIRAFGVGATTNIYRVAIYRFSDKARLTSELAFTTVAQTWVAIGSGLGLTLTAGEIYLIAVSVNTTGTTAGLQCLGATTGRIGVLPTAWPGNLDVDMVSPIISPFGFCQFAVTAGALPVTAPTLAARAAWTGGMPAFFLDANNT